MFKKVLKFITGAAVLSLLASPLLVNAQNIVTSSGVWYRNGDTMLTNPADLNVTVGGDLQVDGSITIGSLSLSGDLDLDGNDIDNVGNISGNGEDIDIENGIDVDGGMTMDGLFTFEESGQIRGYAGVDTGIFTGAAANSIGIRAENAMHIGAGGNSIALTLGGQNGTPAEDGKWFQTRGGTWTDTATAGSGTATYMTFNSFEEPTLAATNTDVSTTIAANLQIPGMPQAGTNQTITNAVGFMIGKLGGYTTNADSGGFGAIFFPPGIADGVGAMDTLGGFNVQSPSGGVSLGDQTATLGEFFVGNYDAMILNSDTLTRTVTDASTIRVRGAPEAGSNVTITNDPYALNVVEDLSRFGGPLRFDGISQDVGATCTTGDFAYDTGGATDELCFCASTDTWSCWSATTTSGPTD